MLSFYKDWVLVQILSCLLEDRQPWQLGDRKGRKWHSVLLNYVVPFHLNVFKWRGWLSFKACISSPLLAAKYSRPRSWRFTSLLGTSFAFPPITLTLSNIGFGKMAEAGRGCLMAVPSYIVQQRQSCRQCPHQQGRTHPSSCLPQFTRLEWCTTCWPILACW